MKSAAPRVLQSATTTSLSDLKAWATVPMENLITGDADIDRDHFALIRLLERIIDIFCRSSANECAGAGRHAGCSCSDEVKAIVAEATELMTGHFERERNLMNSLPRTPAIDSFCGRHQLSHTEFLTRYGMVVDAIDPEDPAAAARNLGILLGEWLHRHSLEYDSVLAALLEARRAGFAMGLDGHEAGPAAPN